MTTQSQEATIRRLPPRLANRIAAGEVIERPASIVKELIDNAIDAGSDHIIINAEKGGSFLEIRDNGIGLNQEDLALCLERHATSKLPDFNEDDSDLLHHISSLGFRGEALTSIGAIARLAIISRTKNSAFGFQIRQDYGQTAKIEPIAAQNGTIVQVSDLFHALPARRKFLKSERYEMALIASIVKKIALAWPHIHFEFSVSGKISADYPAATNPNQRLEQVLNKDFMDNSVPILGEYQSIKISGRAGLATYHRPNSNEQYIFVNKRPVRDRILAGAIRSAYGDVMFRAQHPALVLFISLPFDEIDVNVHPTKSEIRFRDAASVRLLLVGLLKKALHQSGHKIAKPHQNHALEKMRDNIRRAPPPKSSYLTIAEPLAPKPYRASSFSHDYGRSFQDDGVLPQEQMEKPESLKGQVDFIDSQPLGRARAQIHNSYIIAQTQASLIIIDQHAAHERILHERLKKDFKNKRIERKILLVPEIIDLPQEHIIHLDEYRADIEKWGFVIEAHGDDAVYVREIPLLCEGCDIADMVRVIADDLSQQGQSQSVEEKLDQISGNIACRSSIRAGRALSLMEMDEILRQMEATPHSGQCNHGRPTYIEMPFKDIEKLFHRR